MTAAMAKMVATEEAQKVIDRALQMFGGLGVTSGQTVERLYRDVRVDRIWEGTSEIQRVIIAGQIKRPDGKGVITFFVAWWLDAEDL